VLLYHRQFGLTPKRKSTSPIKTAALLPGDAWHRPYVSSQTSHQTQKSTSHYRAGAVIVRNGVRFALAFLELGDETEAGDQDDAGKVEDEKPRPSADQLNFCQFLFLSCHVLQSLAELILL
jgi:hypothetical protein